MDIKIVEDIFRKADFSRETDLKLRLGKDLFPVKRTSLNKLMEEEGIKTHHASKDGSGKEIKRSRRNEREKAPESLGAIERDNPLIKKNKPPMI